MSKHDPPVVRVIEIDPELEALIVKLDGLPKPKACGRLACALRGRHMPDDLLPDESATIDRLIVRFGSAESFKAALQEAIVAVGHAAVRVYYYGSRQVTAKGSAGRTGTLVTKHTFAFGDTQASCVCMYPPV